MQARTKDKCSRAGITRDEVLVCIALFALLAFLFLPALAPFGQQTGGQLIRLGSNAGGVYKQIFAAATENTGGRTNYWAASVPNTNYANYEPTSTDYLRWLMTPYDAENPANGAEVLQQDFSAFVAPGILPVSDLEEFTEETNPWVVVADLNETSTSGTPFMITRNVNEIRLKDWRPKTQVPLENVGTGAYTTPFGEEALIVVRVGGGAEVLNEKRLFWDIVNPNAATNVVLQP